MICGHCNETIASTSGLCPACQNSPLLDGRYELTDILGQGTSGVTYRAERVGSGRAYALKEMAFRTMESVKAQELFEREARVLESLDHPAIPAYVDDFAAGEGHRLSLYLVQELIEGVNLEVEMDSRRYDEGEALETLAELLDILGYLHGLEPPVIHRDIKPSNLMRTAPAQGEEHGDLRLIDFGSVRAAIQQTQAGGSTIAGTFGYMAPEQLVGRASPATDIYGAGVLAVALMTRVDPVELVGDDNVLRWREACEVSSGAEMLLDSMLKRNASERADDAEALAERARSLAAGLDGGPDGGGAKRPQKQPSGAAEAWQDADWQPPEDLGDGEEEPKPDETDEAPTDAELSAPARLLRYVDAKWSDRSVSRLLSTDYGSSANRIGLTLAMLSIAGTFGVAMVTGVWARMHGLGDMLGLGWGLAPVVAVFGFGLYLLISVAYVAIKSILWSTVDGTSRATDAADQQVLEQTRRDEQFWLGPGLLVVGAWIGCMVAVSQVDYFERGWGAPGAEGPICKMGCSDDAMQDERGCCLAPCGPNEVSQGASGACTDYQPRKLALSCPAGMEQYRMPENDRPTAFACCWPGQEYEPQNGGCVGPPECPDGWSRHGGTCVAPADDPPAPLTTVVPAGSVEYVSESADAKPQTFRAPLSMAVMRTEVTRRQWRSVMDTNAAFHESCGKDCPVERVDWYQALVFANRLSDRDGLERCYRLEGCRGTLEGGCADDTQDCQGRLSCKSVHYKGPACRGWRLPSLDEWRYAAFGGPEGRGRDKPPLEQRAWFARNQAVDYPSDADCGEGVDNCGTHPTAQKEPNPWGLFDMVGNVEEWTVNATKGRGNKDFLIHRPIGGRREVAGGTYRFVRKAIGIAHPRHRFPDERASTRGFRLVRTVPYFHKNRIAKGEKRDAQK